MKLKKYKGENLKQVKFLLGGIGTGSISLEGRGSLTDWEIFNRPGKGKRMFGNFVAIWIKEGRSKPRYKIVAGKPFPPYEFSHGLPNLNMEGGPHFKEAEFTNFFPFGIINLSDDNFPLKVSLIAYNPFIPLDPDNSGLPIAIFTYTLKNTSYKKLKFTLAFSMMNPVGTDGTQPLSSPRNECFGKNMNRIIRKDSLSGLYFFSEKYHKQDPRYGNLSLLTDFPSTTIKPYWKTKESWNGLRDFWYDFEDGEFEEKECVPSEEGFTYNGTVGVKGEISPDQEIRVNFYLSWYFPWIENYWGINKEVKGKILKNYYSEKFSSSLEVIEYYMENREYLEEKSRKFAESFFSSDLPLSILNAVSSQLSILKSNTIFRTSDGNLYGFEGCSDNAGCCPLNCTHVWNYEQGLAFLFPSLERSMRQVDYLYNTDEEGFMAFRTNVPLGIKRWGKSAADGQAGTILKFYREWKISGDNEFLKNLWPKVKRSMEYIWKEWDKDEDGIMEGRQHNTYDVDFYGPNPFTSFLYLAALKAISEIAQFLGDYEFAEKCERLFKEGKEKIVKELWNGEYFIQKYNVSPLPPYQFQSGCLSDQLFGQCWAEILNLGKIVDERYIKKSLKSILKYNFKHLSEHLNYMRIYATEEEKGLLICTWPYGGRPEIPVLYCDEVWTGIEFQVATHLIYEDFINEAIQIIETIEDRYDGMKRNPFNHIECGSHYARALACWGLILAYSGFWVDNVKKEIYFRPKISKKNFKIFFSSGKGWGIYRSALLPSKEICTISMEDGFIEVKKIYLKTRIKKPKRIEISVDGKIINFHSVCKRDSIEIEFEDTIRSEEIILTLWKYVFHQK